MTLAVEAFNHDKKKRDNHTKEVYYFEFTKSIQSQLF